MKIIGVFFNIYLPIKKELTLPGDIFTPLLDDLNTPGYIATLHKLFDKAIKGNENDRLLFNGACNIMGFLFETPKVWVLKQKIRVWGDKIEEIEKKINEKVKLRNKARENKNFKEADRIRKELLNEDVILEYKDGKTTWKIK